MHIRHSGHLLLLVTILVGLTACCKATDDLASKPTTFDWNLPPGVDSPLVPENNPMTEAGFQLGRHLFYDTRLSAGGNIACASCHHQEKAFTDGLRHSFGTFGDPHPRNSPPLGNTAWYANLNWANPLMVTLEQQLRGPLFGDDPHEHGLSEANQYQVLSNIAADPVYQQLFAAAFPDQKEEWNYYQHVVPALASFIRGMTSFDSPYDHYLLGNTEALSSAAKAGFELFSSERLKCSQCHLPNHFLTDNHMNSDGLYQSRFHHTGTVASYTFPNTGRHEVTARKEHIGQFRTPSLRNIALTAPYLHDGSQPTLKDLIQTYAKGGHKHPNQDSRITGFELTTKEGNDLIAFLCSLTDDQFITNPRFSNPWPDENGHPRSAPQHPGVHPQCQ